VIILFDCEIAWARGSEIFGVFGVHPEFPSWILADKIPEVKLWKIVMSSLFHCITFLEREP